MSNITVASDSTIEYTINSFYIPNVEFTLNLNNYHIDLTDTTFVYYEPKDYTTKYITYKSKDGTNIPMYLSYKKGLDRNKNKPVLLYGYGGLRGTSASPFYSFTNILFFENGGILAVPLIRGGGALGKNWHQQGKGQKRQNTFDDFIAAAEYLIDSDYTDNEHIAIEGNGLIVGAAMTQRPDLFKAVIGQMGTYDMLRRHLFSSARFSEDEYGTPNDSITFQNIYKYSPLHRIKPYVNYPATLLITSENDDRVPPLHTYKFLQALQDNSFSNELKPHIMYFNENSGHNGAERISDYWQTAIFTWTFLYEQLGIKEVKTDF